MEQFKPDPNFLVQLANTKMPFGKFKGIYLIYPSIIWYGIEIKDSQKGN